MSATADLRAEHVAVGRMLGIMDAQCLTAVRGGSLDPDDLDRVVEFLRVFVDRCHHTKEEQLLFPALRSAGVTSVEDVVARLLQDHVQGREFVGEIAAGVQRLREADRSANAYLADAMTGYTTLLHAHIRVEENECFDVADRELPPAVQDELDVGYDRIEREVVGGGVHEAFHALLDRLERETAAR